MGGVAACADFIGRGHCINPACVQDRKQLPKTIAIAPGMPQVLGDWAAIAVCRQFGGEAGEPVLTACRPSDRSAGGPVLSEKWRRLARQRGGGACFLAPPGRRRTRNTLVTPRR